MRLDADADVDVHSLHTTHPDLPGRIAAVDNQF